MRLVLPLLFLLTTTLCRADWNNWSQNEQRMFVASNIAMAADWATTRNLTRRYSEGYYEKNQILGPYPSKDRVDLFFIGSIIANYYIADALGQYRIFYLGARTAVHGQAVSNNINIGLRLRF
jgi:hypothetical protein